MQQLLGIVLLSILFYPPYDGFGQLVFDQKHDIVVIEGGENFELPWIGGLNSSQYNKADLDGDGMEELILYDRSANIYQIFQINDKTLVPANKYVEYLPAIPEGWVLFVDYNGDGKKDIFSNGDRGIVVFKNVAVTGQPARWDKVADPLLTTGFSGKINLIANAADVPAIADIDSDGDFDILVYNFAIGGHIRYNKNLSQEQFGNADSLEYEINTRTWGQFEECDCNLFAFNGETCEDLAAGRVMHAGGKALLAFDDDGDGDKDLLVGHEQCIELYFYENMGNADSAYMTDFSNAFPDDANPANFHLFPVGYYEDLDFDGVKDLIVAPGFAENIEYKIDFGHSNWLYKNEGENDDPDFIFKKNSFIQDKMLDFGENTVPAFADLNADGRVDLLVSSNGYWNGEIFSGHVIELENTGSIDSPSFVVKHKNYLDLASLDIINPKINFVDYDGDEIVDLTYSGFKLPNDVISWVLINQAEQGEPFSFDINKKEQINLPETATMNDNPTFFDVDEDGFIDLLLGKNGGALEYYKNVNNSFSLIDPAFLGIDRDFSLERLNVVASIGDLDLNNKADLLVTDSRGIGRVYFDFQKQSDPYTSVDLAQKSEITEKNVPLVFDKIAWISSADLSNNGSGSMIAGGARGGLQYFHNTSLGSGGNGGTDLAINIYPNPIRDPAGLHINSNQDVTVELISMLGQKIISPLKVQRFSTVILDVAHLRNGTYVVRTKSEAGASKALLFMILR